MDQQRLISIQWVTDRELLLAGDREISPDGDVAGAVDGEEGIAVRKGVFVIDAKDLIVPGAPQNKGVPVHECPGRFAVVGSLNPQAVVVVVRVEVDGLAYSSPVSIKE
jgi:hypothetical protein